MARLRVRLLSRPVAPAVPLRQALQLSTLAGRRQALADLGLRLLQGALPLLGLLALQRLLDAVATGIGAADRDAAFGAVLQAVAIAAAVAGVGALVSAFAGQLGERHARLCADRCASLLQRHAAALDLLQIESPAIADELHRAHAEAAQRPARVVLNLAALAVALTGLLTMALASAFAAPWLPFVVGGAAVPIALARLRAGARTFAWQEANTQSQRHVGYLAGMLVSRAYGKDLRALDLAGPVADAVDAERQRLRDEQLALQSRRAVGETAAQLFATAALFGGYLFLAQQALAGHLTLGALLLQVQAVQRTQNGVRDALLAYAALRDDQLFLRHVFAFLARRPQVTAPAVPLPLPAGALAVRCVGVRFCYPDVARPVLDGFDLDLRAGERVLLTGSNGAGKSTVVRLLCRLMDPGGGRVELGGIDLRSCDPRAVRERVAVCFQDGVGFELSARDNLEFGAAPARDAALLAAADVVGIGEVLRALPEGLSTRLGRSFAGSRELSAGQWRRLLLARTLARASDLLVLDEPFAALDRDGRERLVHHLAALPRTRTVVVVDHGADGCRCVDRVLVLDGGRIASDQPAAPA